MSLASHLGHDHFEVDGGEAEVEDDGDVGVIETLEEPVPALGVEFAE